MTQRRVRAVYMRGGTSRCLVFRAADLPGMGAERDRILLAALGSPDPYGRQLDGLGGGISSLSKACIVGPTSHPKIMRATREPIDVDWLQDELAELEQMVARGETLDVVSKLATMMREPKRVHVDRAVLEDTLH